MFAEEIGGFEVAFALGGQIQRCAPALALRIHIHAIGDKQFDYFLATSKSRFMQRSPSINIFRIHIRATSQVLFDELRCFPNWQLDELWRLMLQLWLSVVLPLQLRQRFQPVFE